jgi:hypothetical protein
MFAARRSLQLLDQALEVSIRTCTPAEEIENRADFSNGANRRGRPERRGISYELVA